MIPLHAPCDPGWACDDCDPLIDPWIGAKANNCRGKASQLIMHNPDRFYGDVSQLDISRKCRQDEGDRLRKLFQGKSVCLVAQGESAMKTRRASLVEAHDLVVRMNRFNLSGFESFLGERVDVHAFTNNSCLYSAESRRARFFYASDGFLLRENDGPIFTDDNLVFWSRPAGNYDEHLQGHFPTTGFRILLDVLAANPARVTLIGYDFYAGGQPYWSRHAPDIEKALVDAMLDTDGRLLVL